jgi:hypothetical protein
MAIVVLSKVGHELSRRVIGSTLAGDGLLVRIRSTSIGLLGLVAATGLALVAFVSNQGWPDSLNSPIPGSPPSASAVHDAVAVGQPRSAVGASLTQAREVGRGSAHVPGKGGGARSAPSPAGPGHLRGARQVAGPSPKSAPGPLVTSPPAPQPSAPPADEPSDQGSAGPPASTPASTAPSATPPVTSSAEKPQGSSHGHAAPKVDGGGNGTAERESHSSARVKSTPKASTEPVEAPAKPSKTRHATVPPPASTPADARSSEESGSSAEAAGHGHAYGRSRKP